MARRIYIVGISAGTPLTDNAIAALDKSKIILASERLFGILRQQDEFEKKYAHKCKVINPVMETLKALKAARSEVAVISSGDPLFYGIGKKIMDTLPKREIALYPALSSLQLAFARAGMTWHDAKCVSFHGPRVREWAMDDLSLLSEMHQKLAILTGAGNTPNLIATHLPKKAEVWVMERLGHSDERVRKSTPAGIKRMKFKEPNIMVVKNPPSDSPVFGLNENEFIRTKNLITKDEVRAVAIHKLRLPHSGVLWDIGAGSGSVSIEAKRLSPGMKVYAIEQDAVRAGNIKKNALTLNAGEINVIMGKAPSVLKGLPNPDRVFIGGSGPALSKVIKHASDRMSKGKIIVATAITLESLEAATEAFNKAGASVEVTQVSISRKSRIGKAGYMKPLNPVFIIKAVLLK